MSVWGIFCYIAAVVTIGLPLYILNSYLQEVPAARAEESSGKQR